MNKAIKIFLRTISMLATTVLIILATLIITIKMICSNISLSAKELFTTTILETGQMKFLASIFLSKEEIQEVINKNSIQTMEIEVNTDLIDTDKTEVEYGVNGISIEEISGNTFFAKMLIINEFT